MSKKLLRKKILSYRKNNYNNLTLKYCLLKNILKKLNLSRNIKIGGYVPINYEIDSLIILKQLEKSGHKISLPITSKGSKMDFFEWAAKDPLLIGKIGIPEPLPKKKVYPDILLVPLVAFNKYKFHLMQIYRFIGLIFYSFGNERSPKPGIDSICSNKQCRIDATKFCKKLETRRMGAYD